MKGVIVVAIFLSIIGLSAASNYGNALSDVQFQISSTTGELINAKYPSSDKAASLRNSIPRWGYSKDFDPNDQDYLYGLGTLAAPGIVLAIIVIIWAFVFCCCRCCGRCGAGGPPPLGWEPNDKYLPLSFTFVFLACAIAFTGVGLYYNHELSKGISSEDDGIGNLAIDMVGELYSFSDDIKARMTQLSTQVPLVADNVTIYLNRAQVLQVGTNGLINSLSILSAQMSGLKVTVPGESPIPDIVYNCTYCQTVSVTISGIATEMQNKADPIFQDMNSTVNDIKSNVLDIETEITTQVNSAKTQIDDVRSKTDEYYDKAVDYNDDYVKKYDNYREIACIVLLCFPFLWLLLVLIGVPTKMTGFLTCNYIHIWGISFLMFILLGIHLPLAAVTGDSCGYIDEKQSTLNSTFDQQVANVLDACLLNTSLIDALEVRDELDFANLITFPDLPPINESFSFDTLTSFISEVDALTVSTFGYTYDPSTDMQRINNITTVYGDYFVVSNVSSCYPPKYYNPLVDQVTIVNVSRASVIVQTRAYNMLNATLWAMKNNVSAIVAQKDALQAQTTSFVTDFNAIKSSVNPLIDIVKGTENIAYCGFVGNYYAKIKNSYCSTTAESLSFLALSFFLIAVFAQGIAGGSILLAQRYKKDPYEDSRPKLEDWPKSPPPADVVISPKSDIPTPNTDGPTFVAIQTPPADYAALQSRPPQMEMSPVAGGPADDSLSYQPIDTTGGTSSGKTAPELPTSTAPDNEPDPYSTPLPPPVKSTNNAGASLEF